MQVEEMNDAKVTILAAFIVNSRSIAFFRVANSCSRAGDCVKTRSGSEQVRGFC